jgi:hypothetical protein
MLPLFGRAAADGRRSRIGRGDGALPKDGSWTRAPEALVRDQREQVSNTPAELLKPGKTSPPRVEATFRRCYSARDVRRDRRVSCRKDLRFGLWHHSETG